MRSNTWMLMGAAALLLACDGGGDAALPEADAGIVDPGDVPGATQDTEAATTAADTSSATDDVGDGASGGPDAVTGLAIALDDLCQPLAEATCQVFVGCRAGVGADTVAACRTHATATCEASLMAAKARVAAGAVTYDAEAAHACLTRVSLVGCGPLEATLTQLDDECAGVFAGQLGADQACEAAGDCAAGLYCAPDAGGACPGSCQPLGGAGDACDALNAPCDEGALCELGACVPDQVALGAACAVSEQCPAGAFCDDGEAPARCRAVRGVDGACSDDDACAEGLFCSTVDFADEGVCVAKLPRDSVCVPFLSGDQCAGGQACDMEREVCVDRPAAVGDACVEDWRPCGVAGLWCDQGANACVAEPRQGEACGGAGATRCQYGYCSAEPGGAGAGTCLAFAAPGAACSEDRECGGLACLDGACALDPELTCQPRRRGLVLGAGFRLFDRPRTR